MMTTSEIPKPDLERFYSVPAEAVILSYLSRPMALQSLQKNLRPLMSAELVKDAISELIAKGEIADEKTLRVTPAGRQTALKILGRDADEKWENIKSKRLPLVALGLNPDNSDVRSKFSGADTLKTATIAVAFGLPKQMVGARKAVLSEIVWQLLKSTAPSVVGKGPFPIIEKLGVVERAILGGLAGIRPKSIPQAIDALAARAIGLEKTGADALRIRLVAIGVARCRKAKASILDIRALQLRTLTTVTNLRQMSATWRPNLSLRLSRIAWLSRRSTTPMEGLPGCRLPGKFQKTSRRGRQSIIEYSARAPRSSRANG